MSRLYMIARTRLAGYILVASYFGTVERSSKAHWLAALLSLAGIVDACLGTGSKTRLPA